MLDNKETKKVLTEFSDYVITKARINLKPKDTSGKLSRSLDYDLHVSKNSIQLDIKGEEYLEYIDKGVSGIKKKYNTPFSYKKKGSGLKGMPPPSAFDQWNIKKGRAERDEKGKFLSRKQLNFRTAVGVFFYGIKPSNFFSTPFENAFKSLPDDLIEAYGLDLDEFLEMTLKNSRNASI